MRKEEPLRKMSLILMEKLQVIDGQGNEIVVDMEKIPRFGDIIENVQNDFAVGGKEENDKAPMYFLSDVKRYMGSTKWIRVGINMGKEFNDDFRPIVPIVRNVIYIGPS